MGIYNPRNTIIVTCKEGEFDNGCTLSWHSPISFSPFLYGIFLAKKRKSFEMISKSREFCVNFLTYEMEELALLFGIKSGRNVNKFKEGKVEKVLCETIRCMRIANCSAYLECKVVNIIDHFMVVGRVLREVEGNNKKKLFQSNINGPYAFNTTKD